MGDGRQRYCHQGGGQGYRCTPVQCNMGQATSLEIKSRFIDIKSCYMMFVCVVSNSLCVRLCKMEKMGISTVKNWQTHCTFYRC